MKITINGKPQTIHNVQTIQDLLQHLNLTPYQTAVEKNGIIIEKENYNTETIQENDTLELIRFMGGGQ